MAKATVFLVVVLGGCDLYFDEGDGATPNAPPAAADAGGTILYPCNLQHDVCQAARAAAKSICDWRYKCDPMYDVPVERCLASAMAGLCAKTVCNASPYERWPELEACVAEYTASACESPSAICSL